MNAEVMKSPTIQPPPGCQDERQQRVISTGPYAIVRHPMYSGASVYMIGMPLLFGSWLGLLILFDPRRVDAADFH